MKAIPVIKRVSDYVDRAEREKDRPIRVSTGNSKAQCAREVKPEPLPEFSGDRCEGHCEVKCMFASCCRGQSWCQGGQTRPKEAWLHQQYVGTNPPRLVVALAFACLISLLLAARLADAPPIYQSYKLPHLFPRGGRSSDLTPHPCLHYHPLTSWIQTPQAAGDLPSVSVTKVMWKTSQKVMSPPFATGPGVGNVVPFSPAPWTLVRTPVPSFAQSRSRSRTPDSRYHFCRRV